MSELVYTPPGVYVDENAQPVPNIASVVALPPSRVAIVGPSIGYQTYTESVQLTGVTAVTLTQRGINSATVTVTGLDGTLHGSGSDYAVAQTGTPAEEAVTTVTRDAGGVITDGAVVYVTYQYTNSSFYEPYLSTDWDEIQSRYGTAVTSAGVIGSPLSLAAKIVMEAGAREIILVPTKGSTPTSVTSAQIETAYGTIEGRDDIGVVVPLPIGITGTDVSPGDSADIGLDLKAHVEEATANGNYRVGVFGFDTVATRSHDSVASATASKRVMLAYPNVMEWYNGFTNSVMELGGCYLAASYAGMMASRSAQIPLTRKLVRSFSAIPSRVRSTMTSAFKNTLADAGVAICEQQSDGRLVVRHGVSTDPTNVLTREVSITRAKDTKIRLINQAIERSGIIGSAMDAESPVRLRSIVEGALSQAVQSSIIVGFSNLSVRVAVGDQTALEVKYAYQPAYPLNKVMVSFAINTVTGNIQEI